MIDSHFSDFYLNKNLQFLLEKLEEQINLLKLQNSLMQDIKIIDRLQKKQVSLSKELSNSKDSNPFPLSSEILYF